MDAPLSLEQQKAWLRNELRRKLKALRSEEKREQNERIIQQFVRHPRFLEAKFLMTYLALPTEVETRPILREAWNRGIRTCVPRLAPSENRIQAVEIKSEGELKPGRFGILEPFLMSHQPVALELLDLIVVPGLAFDRKGGRLGRGGGHFDRFLAQVGQAYKLGLAFNCQIVERVPQGNTDVALDEVLIG